jgi:hypothetical protein
MIHRLFASCPSVIVFVVVIARVINGHGHGAAVEDL